MLSDLFGKAGIKLLEGLLAGKTVKTILETTENKQLKTKRVFQKGLHTKFQISSREPLT